MGDAGSLLLRCAVSFWGLSNVARVHRKDKFHGSADTIRTKRDESQGLEYRVPQPWWKNGGLNEGIQSWQESPFFSSFKVSIVDLNVSVQPCATDLSISLSYSSTPEARVAASILGSKAFFPASTITSIILGCPPAEEDELAIVVTALKVEVKDRKVFCHHDAFNWPSCAPITLLALWGSWFHGHVQARHPGIQMWGPRLSLRVFFSFFTALSVNNHSVFLFSSSVFCWRHDYHQKA